MNYSNIEEWKCNEIRCVLMDDFGIKPKRSKAEMINQLLKAKDASYIRERQLGEPGKDAVTWQVNGKYALKQFKRNKSVKKMMKEVELQTLASDVGIAPKIIDVDYDRRYILMDKLHKHMVDVNSTKYVSDDHQKQLVKLYKKMDSIGVFHGDPNPLNYMRNKRGKLYVIDFGMASRIDSRLKKKLFTENPNVDIMNLTMVLKLKSMDFPSQSYAVLARQLPEARRDQFGL